MLLNRNSSMFHTSVIHIPSTTFDFMELAQNYFLQTHKSTAIMSEFQFRVNFRNNPRCGQCPIKCQLSHTRDRKQNNEERSLHL